MIENETFYIETEKRKNSFNQFESIKLISKFKEKKGYRSIFTCTNGDILNGDVLCFYIVSAGRYILTHEVIKDDIIQSSKCDIYIDNNIDMSNNYWEYLKNNEPIRYRKEKAKLQKQFIDMTGKTFGPKLTGTILGFFK